MTKWNQTINKSITELHVFVSICVYKVSLIRLMWLNLQMILEIIKVDIDVKNNNKC